MTTSIAVLERYVELSHGRTRYLEAGSGPPAILLHGVGYTSAADSWFLNIEGLAEAGLRVLAVDCLGWGLGDRLDIEYSFGYIVDFVREFQDALGLARSHIVGHSMGGWIASLLAYESPNRVDRLVLVASGGSRTRTLNSMTTFQPPTPEELRKANEARYPGRSDIDEITARDVAKTEAPGALEAYRKILTHMNNPLNRSRYNTTRRLPHITAPTLVLWGSADTVNDPSMGEDTHRLIPGSQLVMLDGIGHGIPTEAPAEFNRVVGSFLTM